MSSSILARQIHIHPQLSHCTLGAVSSIQHQERITDSLHSYLINIYLPVVGFILFIAKR